MMVGLRDRGLGWGWMKILNGNWKRDRL